MRFFAFAFVIALAVSFSYGRNLASIRKDAFIVGVSKSDSAAEYDFISEITAKMKLSRFRIVVFENANAGQKLLTESKIDAIISKVNYFPHMDSKFLVSEPYSKTEIAVAVLAKNDKILTLTDLSGKRLAFVSKDISNEQILEIWQNSKPNAVSNLGDAVNLLKKGEVDVIIANRQSMEAQKDPSLRIFPNKLLENNIVALFALNSKDLQDEFNKALKTKSTPTSTTPSPASSSSTSKPESKEQKAGTKERLDRAMNLLNELKKELEFLQKEVK